MSVSTKLLLMMLELNIDERVSNLASHPEVAGDGERRGGDAASPALSHTTAETIKPLRHQWGEAVGVGKQRFALGAPGRH
jgi:hypothetical protein